MRNGIDRQIGEESNAWECSKGSSAQYTLAIPAFVKDIRLAFDSDLKRDHLNMVSNYTLVPAVYTPPETLVKKFHLEIDGKTVFTEENNYQRFVVVPVEKKCAVIKLVIDELHSGVTSTRVFRFDFS